ncbi:MAG: enoyl-CoA hydratase/isomerase family protein [Terriglobales bacterium]
MFPAFLQIDRHGPACLLRLTSPDGTNRLTRACMLALTVAIGELRRERIEQLRPLIIAGNRHFFSVGADLNEIAALTGPEAYEFSAMGQALMNAIADYPDPVIAAIEGHCMGGGLDLALACHRRIAAPHAVFGHRGAALGLMTGWGGTQRLPRLIGKGRALELFTAAEKISAARAFEIGLADAIAADPVAEALRQTLIRPMLIRPMVKRPVTSPETPSSKRD